MKEFIRPSDYTWAIWLMTTCLLLFGIFLGADYFLMTIGITALQALFFIIRERSFSSFPAQVRIAYLFILMILYFPPLRSWYWIPAAETFALCFSGYSLLARCLSLFSWNRTEPLTASALIRTFITLPRLDISIQERLASSCLDGVSSLEVQLGKQA